ncbi:MAG: glycosyltransferase family 39 protein [Caldilineaceae bacterium]|nr:glycosyltransferase family 39 protein [Caldilineaceae bacterium]
MKRTTLAWFVTLLTLGGLVLRLLRLAWQPLWWDEGYSVYFATEPLARMTQLTAQDIHPPLYYGLLHTWLAALGRTDPVTLRAFSVAWGILALPLMVWLARDMFPARPRLWLTAGLLLAVSPMHLFYSQEIRMYAMAMTLTLGATLCFWRFMQRPTWERGALYAVTALLALYTLYYSALVLAGHFVWAAWQWRRMRIRLAALLGLGAALAIGYLPWLLYALPKLTAYVGNKVATDADRALPPLAYLRHHGQTFFAGHIAPATAYNPLDAALGILMLAGWIGLLLLVIAIATRRKNREENGLFQNAYGMQPVRALAIFLLVPLLIAFLLNLRLPFFPQGGERLLLPILPFWLLLLAAGIDRTWDNGYVGKSVLGAIGIAALAGATVLFTTPRYADRDYRPLIGQIVQQGAPGDTLFAVFPWQVGYWRAYVTEEFRTAYGPEAHLAGEGILTWGEEIQAGLDEALTQGAVWFPEPLAFGSTLPGEIEAYLASRGANLVNRWYNPTTRLTAWRVLPPGETKPVDADFGPVTLTKAAVAPSQAAAANDAMAITLVWQMQENSIPDDYYVTLRLMDAEGRQWAARDYAPLGGLAQSVDGQLTEQTGMTVPAGLPPGVYTLTVGVGEAATEALLRPETVGAEAPPFQPLADITVTQPLTPLPAARLPVQFRLAHPAVDNGLALLGHAGATDASPTMAGTELAMRLFFQNQSDMPPVRRLYVSLRNARNQAVVEWEGWPLPAYPTETWPEGALVQVPVAFYIPPTVTTGDYTLMTRLVNPAGGGDGPVVELGKVAVRQRVGVFDAPVMEHVLEPPVRFGAHADLIGYDLSIQDNGLDVRLYWQAVQPLLPPHHIFIHVTDAAGNILAQTDGAPVTAAGPAPTGSWLPGEYLTTEHHIELAAPLPDDAILRVGLYNPDGNVRLPASSGGDAVELTP